MKVWKLVHELGKLPRDAEVYYPVPGDSVMSQALGQDELEPIERVDLDDGDVVLS